VELPDASNDAQINQKLDAMLQANKSQQADHTPDDDIAFGRVGYELRFGGWGDVNCVYPADALTRIQEGDRLVDILELASKSIAFPRYVRVHSHLVKDTTVRLNVEQNQLVGVVE
jgi:hypothetical protein